MLYIVTNSFDSVHDHAAHLPSRMFYGLLTSADLSYKLWSYFATLETVCSAHRKCIELHTSGLCH